MERTDTDRVAIETQSVEHTTGAVEVDENYLVVLVPTVLPPNSIIRISNAEHRDEVGWSPEFGVRIFGPAIYSTTKVSYVFHEIPLST